MRSLSVFPVEKIARFVKSNLPALRRALRKAWRHTVQGLGVSLGEWDLYDFHGLLLREWSSAGPPADAQAGINIMDHIRPLLTPDEPADCWERGAHTFRYAALPHARGFRRASLPLQALAFNTPLAAIPVKKSKGALPARHSFLSTGPDQAVLLTALKKSENSPGLAARVYDAHGRGAAVKFRTTLPLGRARPANMIEEPQTAESSNKARAKADLAPWRIQTYLMKTNGAHAKRVTENRHS